MFNLPQKIKYVLKTLESRGFEAFVVGGCVRDMIMGKIPHDYDITTSATPNEIISVFENCIPTGIKHGTVTVVIDREPIEVTTFRCDGDYADHRRPEKVSFVRNIEADLSRRDFTVNALAFNESVGVVDLFGGKKDIEKKILRTVGDAELRFGEDALRILRLFRFASVLDFEIEEKTLLAAQKKAELLSFVSRERIEKELEKMLLGSNLNSAQHLIKCGGLSFLGISECENLNLIGNLPKKDAIRFFGLSICSNANPQKLLSELRASNRLKKEVETLEKISKMPIKTKADIKEILNISGEDLFSDYLEFAKVFSLFDIANALANIKEIKEKNEPFKISDLAIDGNCLLALGIHGENVGETLEKLRKAVVLNPENNKEKILLEKLNNLGN